MARRRVAVLGGGLGGLSAAWHLTQTPALRERYEVTVYQMGWRLGGKGASGRGPNGRIEEHGLHLFFGFYDNTFSMVRALYQEAEGDGLLPSWQHAFAAQDELTLYCGEARDQPWRISFPRNPGTPGDGGEFPDVREGLRRALVFGLHQLRTLAVGTRGPRGLSAPTARLGARLADRLLRQLDDAGDHDGRAAFLSTLAGLRRVVGGMTGDRLRAGSRAHKTWVLVDWAVTLVQGIVVDRLMRPGAWQSIDDLEYRDWLARHGASQATLDSMLVRSYYAAVLASSADRALPVGAGTALHTQLRMFLTYRGSFLWKMTVGMGETLFTPLHRVLRQRGVRFAFFHQLRDVVPGRDQIDSVHFDVQATVRDGVEAYRPLVRVRGLDAWTSAPDPTQLVEDIGNTNFDRYTTNWSPPRKRVLRRGQDFDDIVFAIPVGAIPHVAGSLCAASPRWRLAAKHGRTIQTQSFQLWLKRSLDDLDWTAPPPFATCFAPPVDTWASMEQALPYEDWAEPNSPRGLLYFTGFLDGPDAAPVGDTGFAERMQSQVSENLRRYVHHHLGDAVPGLGPSDLHHPPGISPLKAQLAKANVEPWERYALSAPGTNDFRIRPDDTGFSNLTVAGDWTSNGFYSACAEGTVISGILAARALSGETIPNAGEGLW